MKKCNKCKLILDIDCFGKNKSKSDGLQTFCKTCQKILKDIHYSKNKADYLAKNNSRRNRIKEKLLAIKNESGCKFCGEKEPCCLDFHHIDPESKVLGVSQFIQSGYFKQAFEEIEKCIVICSNCHRKLHKGLINM